MPPAFCLGRILTSEPMAKSACLGLTSKMSHDGSWRAACRMTINTLLFRFGHHEVARGVTDPGVGSSALLGGWVIHGLVVARGQCSSKSQHAGSELSDPRARISQGEVRQRAPYPGRCAATNTSLILTEITIDLSCRIGAERPNVKDEPRPQRARCVPRDKLLSNAPFRKQKR